MKRPVIIQVSFKTMDIEDKLLLDWLEGRFEIYGKANYIKLILKEKMREELDVK
ncbi:MAG: hypothetical protein RSD36_17460 [Terrisporobacter sp.]